jgi:protein-L-isoaspartate(D-aspartate) O-methyltransferase
MNVMTMNVEHARHAMIEQQVRPWDIVDLQVLAAMSAVPRENFVPAAYRDLAFADTELPIGHGETMFKPVLEGRMLQGLKLQPNDEVLEIGTGTGYITACLASLCRSLVSVDLHADFIADAKERLTALDLNNVRYEQADALAFDPGQQFDAIAVTGAVTEVPPSFLNWLRPGGRLFIIRGQSPAQEAVCLTRTAQGFDTDSLFETDIPYLVGAQPIDRFSL